MANQEQTGFSFNSVDLLIYMWKKRVVLLIAGLIAAVTSIVVSLLITPMYESSVIMFPTTNTNVSKELLVNYYSGDNVHGFGEEEQAEQLLQVLHSEPIRSRIIEKYDLLEHYEIDPESKYPMTELKEQYRSNINFRLTEFMSVEISVMDKDPELSAAIANDIADLVDTVYNDMKKERAREAYRLVEREYRESETELARLKDTLRMMSDQLTKTIDAESDEEPTTIFLKAFSKSGGPYLSLLNQVEIETHIAANLNLRYREARLEAEQNLPHKFVVERAVPPEKKAYPNKSLIVIVSTFSTLLLALIVLIVTDNIKARVAARKEE